MAVNVRGPGLKEFSPPFRCVKESDLLRIRHSDSSVVHEESDQADAIPQIIEIRWIGDFALHDQASRGLFNVR